MDSKTQRRSAIARRVGSLLLSPDFRPVFGRSNRDDQGIVVVLPDDSVAYMLDRTREFPGGATVLVGDEDGITVMHVSHTAEPDIDADDLCFQSLNSDMAMLVEFGRQQRGRAFHLRMEEHLQVELVDDGTEKLCPA